MTKQVRVNIRTLANTKAVRKEKRNGRDVMIVPSATLPDNVVMNNILYPADEIANSYASLNRTPAPLGHPMINGRFVSARDPEGINISWVGAWNDNVRRENGRVLLDKVIDVERANQSEGGKALLDAINKGEPVHTSTGLLCNLEDDEAADHKYIARNIEFDHDAILLNEEGAATPEQGVGMFVNSQGDNEEIEVINSSLEQDFDQEIEGAAESIQRAVERKEERQDNRPAGDRIKDAILKALGLEGEPSANRKEADMTVTKEQFDELSAKVNALTESVSEESLGKTIGEAVANAVKPLVEAQEEIKANQEAKDKAEKADLVAKIVKANILDEAEANELTLNAARKLAEKAKPGSAANLNSAFKGNEEQDEWAEYDMNAEAK